MIVRVLDMIRLGRLQFDLIEVRRLIMCYITYTFTEKRMEKRGLEAGLRVD